VNKIDRPDARIDEVIDEVYDLFIDLDAVEEQLSFPVLLTNARAGTAAVRGGEPGRSLQPLFDAILSHVPPPTGDPGATLQFLVTNSTTANTWGGSPSGGSSRGRCGPRRSFPCAGSAGWRRRSRDPAVRVRGADPHGDPEAGAGDIVALAGWRT